MAFSSGNSSAVSPAPNVTPLIDILLVLLIIFMVIVPIAPHGLPSLIPQAEQRSEPSQSQASLTIRVIASGERARPVLYRIEGLDGRELEGRRLDLAGIERALVQHPSRPALWISGDASLQYGSVVELLARARSAGYRTIGLLPRGQ